MTAMSPLTHDDLLWMIGQKEATLLVVTKQAQALLAENERLRTDNAGLKQAIEEQVRDVTDNRQTLGTPAASEVTR